MSHLVLDHETMASHNAIVNPIETEKMSQNAVSAQREVAAEVSRWAKVVGYLEPAFIGGQCPAKTVPVGRTGGAEAAGMQRTDIPIGTRPTRPNRGRDQPAVPDRWNNLGRQDSTPRRWHRPPVPSSCPDRPQCVPHVLRSATWRPARMGAENKISKPLSASSGVTPEPCHPRQAGAAWRRCRGT